MVHACNPSIQEAEAGGLLQVQDQPCLGSKFLGKEGETSGGRETADVAVIYLASTRSKVLNSSVYRHRHREGREKEVRRTG